MRSEDGVAASGFGPTSRTQLPPGVEEVLEQHRRRERIHVLLAAAGAAALLPDGGERPRRAHPLVPQLDR